MATSSSSATHDDGVTIRSAGALVVDDVTKSFGDRQVLDGITLRAQAGRRIGIIGDNGAGKSTLLKIIAGLEHADGGTVTRPPDTALLEQELRLPPTTTIRDVVEGALSELRAAAERVQQLAGLVQSMPDDTRLANEFGDELEWAQAREAWDADHRVDRVMRGLGLDRFPRTRTLADLSGGERSRVAMAALLVRQPRALLLDEPTNHLDDAGLAFVQRHLVGLPGVVLLTSHDRTFLDEVCTDVFDLDPKRGRPTRFGGTFSRYLEVQAAERRRWDLAYVKQQQELAALGTVRDRPELGVGANPVRGRSDNDKIGFHNAGQAAQKATARRGRRAKLAIERIESELVPEPPKPLRFTAGIGAPVEEGDELLAATRGVAVEGRLAPVDVDVDLADRLLVTGQNGAGKSTLLAVLAGLLEPTSGDVYRRPVLRIGMLRQDSRFTDPTATPVGLYLEVVGAERAEELPLADLGLLHAADLERPVGVLSEGQRRRVELALLVADAPQLLLLDEPTNHLSPTLVTDLEAALLDAPCGVVVASHDRWIRQRWPGRVLHLGDD